MALILELKVTEAGKAIVFNAANTGLQVTLTHVAFGTGAREPDGTELALTTEVKRVPILYGSRILADQIRVSAVWSSDTEEAPIREIGLYVGTTLFGYWSRIDSGEIGTKSLGVDFVFYYDWKIVDIPLDNVTVAIDPDAAQVRAALSVHENDPIPHPQYLLRSEVAMAASRLKWAGAAGGTPNSLILTLPLESYFTAYRSGQSFEFVAVANNTGAVVLRVGELESRSVRKNGQDFLDANDIVAGRIYTVQFDGSNLQLQGSIGSGDEGTIDGDVFRVYPFVATAGQTKFTLPVAYDVGTLMAFQKGAVLPPNKYAATDGQSVVLNAGATEGDDILVVLFSATSAAEVYLKSETYNRAEITNIIAAALDGIESGMVETVALTERTLTANDHRNRIRFSAGAILSIPAGITSALTVEIEQAGTAPVTISAAPGVTVNSEASYQTSGRYAVITIRRVGTNEYTISSGVRKLRSGFVASIAGTYLVDLEPGVYSALVIGGGGGGCGTGTDAQPTTGSGGGSGYADKGRITVIEGDRLTVRVGSGGISGGTSQAQFGGTTRVSRGTVKLIEATGGQSGYLDGVSGALGGKGGSGGGSAGGAWITEGQFYWCTGGDGGADGASGGISVRTHPSYLTPSYAGGVGEGVGYYRNVNNKIDPTIDHGAKDFNVRPTGLPADAWALMPVHGSGGRNYTSQSPVLTGVGGSGGGGGGGFGMQPYRIPASRDGSGYGAGGGALHAGFAGFVSIVRVLAADEEPATDDFAVVGVDGWKRNGQTGVIEQWGTYRIGPYNGGAGSVTVPFNRKFPRRGLNVQCEVISMTATGQPGYTVQASALRPTQDGFVVQLGEPVDGAQDIAISWRAIGD